MGYEFTQDYVTSRIPQWLDLFADFIGQPDIQFLEVGSFEGRSAVWFLEKVLTHESSKLVCVDSWSMSAERERRFDSNIANSGQSHRVEKKKTKSRRALGWFPDETFDAIYVDGSHEACDVLLDALLALPLLKRGGILLFDDYEWQDKENHRHHLPKPGIDAFLSLCDYRVEVIHKDYQVAVRRVA